MSYPVNVNSPRDYFANERAFYADWLIYADGPRPPEVDGRMERTSWLSEALHWCSELPYDQIARMINHAIHPDWNGRLPLPWMQPEWSAFLTELHQDADLRQDHQDAELGQIQPPPASQERIQEAYDILVAAGLLDSTP